MENNLPQVHEEVDADLKRVESTEAREKAKEKTQAREEVQPMFNIEDVEGVDFLQPFLHMLSPSLIELLRFCETARAFLFLVKLFCWKTMSQISKV